MDDTQAPAGAAAAQIVGWEICWEISWEHYFGDEIL